MNFDAESQAAVDLAKRATPKGGELELGTLLAALYHSTGMKERFPQLGSYLETPEENRKRTPKEVDVAEPLQPILDDLLQDPDTVTVEEFFTALIESDTGHEFLMSKGMSETDIEAMMVALGGARISDSGWRGSPEREAAIRDLSSYGRMLTATELPSRGMVEMEKPLRSLIRTLSKMRRRNAMVIGHAGTGKSALVYEFSRRLVRGDESIPARLRDLDVFELSPAFLRAGAGVVGEYDKRIKKLLGILQEHPKVVLFVDEIHSLLQSSMHERSPFTEANETFKAALARGDFACIGCTTTSEYRFFIERDTALARRFSMIKIEPPSAEATVGILHARRPPMLEYYSPLRIPDAVLERTVELTEEYIPGRFQPDKSIQLLDEACAYCVTAEPPLEEVGEEALWTALEDIIGHSIVRSERIDEAELFEKLRAKIVGQDETLRQIARAFVAGLGAWVKKSRPRGVFFFAGPTGVGKTETAVLLSKILGGGRESLVRVDCNTLQGVHDPGPALNILLGVAPGYIGYVRGKGGLLSKVRDRPESIVLFDEIEKAHPGVGKVLLQIIDNGNVEDNDGNFLDFRRAFIIFTTNAGCVYDRHQVGFDRSGEPAATSPRVDTEALKGELRALGLGEEFLGRISHWFNFQGLEVDSVEKIIELQLTRLQQTAAEMAYALAWDTDIVGYLSSQWQPRFGVRHLTTILRNRIEEQLSVADAQGELKGVSKIYLEVLDTIDQEEARRFAGVAERELQGDTLIINLA
ncbi:MAG: AAA family ATPase [Gemmatimonadales bacterium]|jgi:ATP-dependent Clp protease ATP-binding subunit ClpA